MGGYFTQVPMSLTILGQIFHQPRKACGMEGQVGKSDKVPFTLLQDLADLKMPHFQQSSNTSNKSHLYTALFKGTDSLELTTPRAT